nr:PREDICTED: fructose-2,6-bisphosphatase TIGAR [Latimeria chalumnae]|eukprot:XP_005989344.1 PREDICTED: fructose-2,6-bisphosphatase TIGAR [Latimeria chalumnae]
MVQKTFLCFFDLLRANAQVMTASTILSNIVHCRELKINYDTRLRERRYGEAEGKPLRDLKAMAKAAGQQCPTYTPAGGETLEEVRARAREFFEFLCQLMMEQAIQCWHGQDALATASGGSEKNASNLRFPNTDHYIAKEFSSDIIYGANDLEAHVLLVSHGAYMRTWIKYFVEDLNCILPLTLTKSELFSASPNTGVSHFVVNVEGKEQFPPDIYCIYINKHDHLQTVEPS